MSRNTTRTGVCVIRVEVQESGRPLITITMRPDIEDASVQEIRRTTELDAAVATIGDFLRDFHAGDAIE